MFVALAAAMLGLASPAGAVDSLMGGYLAGSFPSGDWGDIAGFGLALDGTNVTYPKTDKPFAIRSSSGLLYNFSRTVSVPVANLAPNSALDLETKNWSLYFGIGPEFSKKGGNISPFIFGSVGFDTYWTSSELSGTAGGSPYSAEHGDSRISFAWAGGFGVRKHVSPGETIEISAEYRSGTEHHFVLPSEVTGSGTTVIASRDSRSSDQILLRIGTMFGY
jgi:hypothetical protein